MRPREYLPPPVRLLEFNVRALEEEVARYYTLLIHLVSRVCASCVCVVCCMYCLCVCVFQPVLDLLFALLRTLRTTADQLQRTSFGEVIVFYPPAAQDASINLGASWIARRQIRGPAVLIPEMGLKGRFLYCLLRPGARTSIATPSSPITNDFYLRLTGCVPDTLVSRAGQGV